MKSLTDYINESINISSDTLMSPSDYKSLIDKYGKNSKEKKIFKAFIDFIKDKVDGHDFSVDEFKDYIQNEAFGDFLENYQSYGLKQGADEDFDGMRFDLLCVEILKIANR